MSPILRRIGLEVGQQPQTAGCDRDRGPGRGHGAAPPAQRLHRVLHAASQPAGNVLASRRRQQIHDPLERRQHLHQQTGDLVTVLCDEVQDVADHLADPGGAGRIGGV